MIVGYFRHIDQAGAVAPMALLRVERCLRIESDEPGRYDCRASLLADLAGGDVFVSPSIPHLAVSAVDLLGVVARVHRAGATMRLVAEGVDTSIAAARNALVAVAEYERGVMHARREAGRYQAALRAAPVGRPRKLDEALLVTIRDELGNGQTYAAIARALGVHPTTIMRMLRRADGNG